jgi:cobalt-precorrin-5B (C1)-methyltransferase
MKRKPERRLRKGWTTGACAAAAAKSAWGALLTGEFADPVTITLPRGKKPAFALARTGLGDGWAEAAVIKDAGDDPDVTHGATIVARVARGATGSGVTFRAGEGVGTVTLPGLPLAVGEPAINPAPRRMIADAIATVAPGDVEVTISIPGGEEIARKTWNPRLGILGGLSVLGTTGIVIPYSCSSWIHSIHRGIDVARATGVSHIAGATGATSEAAVRARYGLADSALIDMGDFAGGLLKYLRNHPVPRLTMAGGFAKLAKLGQGHLDLHSSRSTVDFAGLGELLADLGAADDAVEAARGANTAGQVLAISREAGLPLGDAVARRAREVVLATLSGGVAVDVCVFDREGGLAGHAGP